MSSAIAVDPASTPLLILDFDGTLCLGDGPVRAYADAVAHMLPTTEAQQLHDGLGRFLDRGTVTDEARAARAPSDGYAAVAALSGAWLTAEQLSAAYRESRQQLAAGTVTIGAAPGLRGLLDSLNGRVHRILVTNSPSTGIHESLIALGLHSTIDTVITEAQKPAGFDNLLATWTAHRAPNAIRSVGDVWENDIRQPLDAGCSTAYIDRFGHNAGPAHLRSSHFEHLFDGILEWADDPDNFSLHHLIPSPTEQKEPKL